MKKNIMLIFAFLFLLIVLATSVSEATDDPSKLLQQVAGKVTLGPIEFSPPQGFWYNPPPPSTKMSFAITFYKTKKDIILMQEDPSPARDPIVVVRINSNSFKDFDSYYKAESEMYRIKGLEGLHYFKKLPQDVQSLFAGMSTWSCRERVNKGYPELTAIDCLSLNHYSVLISTFCFDEKKVLGMAPILKSIMKSVKRSQQKD
ncbi:MAG: hypothetical protein PHU49_06175 [Syntrophorhabdaceae bacterium]|nr:hypothetical protein [Syntrophorhabdaceae bacterium]MDD5243587.1 hypothetical protein [Syntrophorhabdaceae bacterium]